MRSRTHSNLSCRRRRRSWRRRRFRRRWSRWRRSVDASSTASAATRTRHARALLIPSAHRTLIGVILPLGAFLSRRCLARFPRSYSSSVCPKFPYPEERSSSASLLVDSALFPFTSFPSPILLLFSFLVSFHRRLHSPRSLCLLLSYAANANVQCAQVVTELLRSYLDVELLFNTADAGTTQTSELELQARCSPAPFHRLPNVLCR